MNITKRDISDEVKTKLNLNIDINYLHKIVSDFFDELINGLVDENTLEFRNFGVFKIRETKARIGHNPKTKEKVHVSAKKNVSFFPSKKMKREVLRRAR